MKMVIVLTASAALYQRSHRKKDQVSLQNNVYLKVTKFSGILNLAILVFSIVFAEFSTR